MPVIVGNPLVLDILGRPLGDLCLLWVGGEPDERGYETCPDCDGSGRIYPPEPDEPAAKD